MQWSGGTERFLKNFCFFSVQTSPSSGTPVVDFGQQSGTSLTWNVNVTVGTQLTLNIKDSTGLAQSSAPFPVTTSGAGDSCLCRRYVSPYKPLKCRQPSASCFQRYTIAGHLAQSVSAWVQVRPLFSGTSLT
ncbi:hypothetical protein GGX14DRAFT_418560 [Mycena pura]|uniref:Uncharacterized protein n=1 Tax=Mycena pura TaxID=153505 RepID=A0AAD6YRH3_9AGAR|nr:hypothetical protein GGX14DRAFT_418560 [Mycena pura]